MMSPFTQFKVLFESGPSSTANQRKHDQGSVSKTGNTKIFPNKIVPFIYIYHKRKTTHSIQRGFFWFSEAASTIKESTSWRPFNACQHGGFGIVPSIQIQQTDGTKLIWVVWCVSTIPTRQQAFASINLPGTMEIFHCYVTRPEASSDELLVFI